jgi:hypothetical protein
MREHESNTAMQIGLYLGLDVHKDSVTIAVAQGGRRRERQKVGVGYRPRTTWCRGFRALGCVNLRLQPVRATRPPDFLTFSRARAYLLGCIFQYFLLLP